MNDDYGLGVKYRDSDYVGFLARITILLIDSVVVLLLLLLAVVTDTWLIDDTQISNDYYLTYTALFVSYIYLTLIKASQIGTFGQMATKTRIETIRGEKPGQLRMSFRLLFWLLGPVNFLTDLVFMTTIKEKRSIRDCFCNTIIIMKGSKPIGRDVPVRVARVYAFGLNLMYESCYSEIS